MSVRKPADAVVPPAPAVHEVHIPSESRTILVPDNANLRESLLRVNIPLHFGLGALFHCRGRARCGTCLVRVLSGAESLSEPTPFEKRRIAVEGLPFRLACQAQVRGPLAIDPRGH